MTDAERLAKLADFDKRLKALIKELEERKKLAP